MASGDEAFHHGILRELTKQHILTSCGEDLDDKEGREGTLEIKQLRNLEISDLGRRDAL